MAATRPAPPFLDDFDALYASNAPANSVAAGDDYGRMSALAALGILLTASTLEKLVLADARCHMMAVKVVSYEQETHRRRLHGHSCVFSQAPDDKDVGWGEAAIQAALGHVRISFVGPKGHQTRLEKSALLIPDLRLLAAADPR